MRNNYEVRAQKFIREFFPYVESSIGDHWRTMIDIQSYNIKFHRNVHFAHGLARVAFISSDYVIKMDYDIKEVKRFGGCADEVRMYQRAVDCHMEYLFAKITPYKYNGHMFYIMPRIKGIAKTPKDAWAYMTKQESNWCMNMGIYDLHCYNYGWKNNHIVLIDYGAQE